MIDSKIIIKDKNELIKSWPYIRELTAKNTHENPKK